MSVQEPFEVELCDVYNYRFSYGGQSAYFRGLEQGKLVASKCSSCGTVWLPLRPTCSKCYAPAEPLELAGAGRILSSLLLTDAPPALRHTNSPVASALILVDGADTCIKAMVSSASGQFSAGTRVEARFAPPIRTIADFHFVTIQDHP